MRLPSEEVKKLHCLSQKVCPETELTVEFIKKTGKGLLNYVFIVVKLQIPLLPKMTCK